MLGFVAAAVIPATSDSGFKCNGEVGGDGEGILLSEWHLDLDFLAIHSLGPHSSTKYIEAPKIRSTTRGIPTRSGPWLAAPFPFGMVGPTGDMGPVSQFCVCVCDALIFVFLIVSKWNTSTLTLI